MDVRTQQYVSVAISLAVALLVGLSLARTEADIDEAVSGFDFSIAVLTGISELRYVTFEYVLSRHERPRTQWAQKQKSLAALLAAPPYQSQKQQKLASVIQGRNADLKEIFSELTQLHDSRETVRSTTTPELEARLVARLLEFSQRMVVDSNTLARESKFRLEDAQQQAAWLAGVLVFLLVAVVVANALISARTILAPISKLREGAEKIGGGDLAYRIGTVADNEIGRLSQAFDTMTERLSTSRRSLEESAAALRASNRELEGFSYSAAHDLRTPLRSIDGFARVLEEDYGAVLDERGKSHLQRVRAAAQRLASLIDDMQELSRISRGELTRQEVDLSAMVREIADQLAAGAPGRNARFDIAPGIHVAADPHLVRMLLEQLLDNAWKFTAQQPLARIEFGTAGKNAGNPCYVRDNGAGFDMAYAANLFVPFQRMHTSTEFPGNGIGLAMAKRIVERHSGRIWAESTPDKGATFYFTLAGGDLKAQAPGYAGLNLPGVPA